MAKYMSYLQWLKKHPNATKEQKDRFHRKRNGSKEGDRWSELDQKLIMGSTCTCDVILSLQLRRSVRAIKDKRRQLKKAKLV